ncbi:Uncharacterised protein [Vibrio cholerae]|nr:Uncharacterised protein [Vibrio cholerae]
MQGFPTSHLAAGNHFLLLGRPNQPRDIGLFLTTQSNGQKLAH